MKKLTSIFVIGFLLIGCTSKVIITPDKLPDAIVGQPYSVEIDISGGSGPVTASGFESSITPNVLWLEVNEKKDNFYNSFIIHGTPRTTDDITVRVKGYMIQTTPFGSSSEFDKTYIIKVKESK